MAKPSLYTIISTYHDMHAVLFILIKKFVVNKFVKENSNYWRKYDKNERYTIDSIWKLEKSENLSFRKNSEFTFKRNSFIGKLYLEINIPSDLKLTFNKCQLINSYFIRKNCKKLQYPWQINFNKIIFKYIKYW